MNNPLGDIYIINSRRSVHTLYQLHDELETKLFGSLYFSLKLSLYHQLKVTLRSPEGWRWRP